MFPRTGYESSATVYLLFRAVLVLVDAITASISTPSCFIKFSPSPCPRHYPRRWATTTSADFSRSVEKGLLLSPVGSAGAVPARGQHERSPRIRTESFTALACDLRRTLNQRILSSGADSSQMRRLLSPSYPSPRSCRFRLPSDPSSP